MDMRSVSSGSNVTDQCWCVCSCQFLMFFRGDVSVLRLEEECQD